MMADHFKRKFIYSSGRADHSRGRVACTLLCFLTHIDGDSLCDTDSGSAVHYIPNPLAYKLSKRGDKNSDVFLPTYYLFSAVTWLFIVRGSFRALRLCTLVDVVRGELETL